MRCVIFGATGYLGARLVPELLSAGHHVRVMARTPAKLDDVPWRQDVEVVEGDVADADTVRRALDGQRVLYYLVHSMLSTDFVDLDARAASIVADAARQAGLSRIVYVGGIIADQQHLSDHLASRAEVGRLLRDSGVPTAELLVAAIIGAGSASFEMLRYLTERLPLMVTPKSAANPGATHCDPRRAVLPDERGRLAGRCEPSVRHRRSGHIHLHRDDPQVCGDRWPAAPTRHPVAGTDSVPVLALGEPDHPAAAVVGVVVDEIAGERCRLRRARYRPTHPRPKKA